jgi:hypothetical protein
MAVKVIRQGEPDDSEIYFDPHAGTWEVKVWDEAGRLLKVGGPYKSDRAARFADQRMMGFKV